MRSDQDAQGFIHLVFERLQGWSLHRLTRQTAPLLIVLAVKQFFLISRYNLLSFTLGLLFVVLPPLWRAQLHLLNNLPVGTGGCCLSGAPKANCSPGWTSPVLAASPQSTSAPVPKTIMVALHWTHSSSLIPFLHGEAQHWT